MIAADAFLDAARALGLGLWTGVPCSYLKPFINGVLARPDLRYVGAANEGDAVAIASGAALAGTGAVVMMQNSGLGNAVNPLTSLNAISRVPVLLIVTWRGEPGGDPDEPQHERMGAITTDLLELIGIGWERLPREDAAAGAALARAVAEMRRSGLPRALVMSKDTVRPTDLAERVVRHEPAAAPCAPAAWAAAPPPRSAMLAAVQQAAGTRDALVASTGYTGRALYALADRPNQLYLVGAMGCASSLGLGLALAGPARRVVVLDGDGALLMRMGALATIGHARPPNLVHVVLDNQAHDSTGGQSTVTHSLDLAAVAGACGYPRVARAASPEALRDLLAADQPGLTFVHARIGPHDPLALPRPQVTPPQVAARFSAWLREAQAWT